MKKIITRLAVSLGAAALAPAVMVQPADASSARELCRNPDRAAESKALWDFVQAQDKTEVYVAYLEACGASPLTAEYAAIARQIVIDRTANFQNMPDSNFRLTLNPNTNAGFSADYVF